LVMLWKCWNLPPVPVTRLWALAFGGMSVGMLYQFWRAEAWKKETEKLELDLQGQRLLPRRQVLPKTEFSYRCRRLLDVGACFVLPESAVQFLTVTDPFDPDTAAAMPVGVHLSQRTEAAVQNILHTQSVFRATLHEVSLALFRS